MLRPLAWYLKGNHQGRIFSTTSYSSCPKYCSSLPALYYSAPWKAENIGPSAWVPTTLVEFGAAVYPGPASDSCSIWEVNH